MKKLLQATSAMALMLMSSQVFASNSNFDYNEEETRQITNNLRNEGNTDQQIADHFTVARAFFSLIGSHAENTFASPVVSASAPQISNSNFDENAIQEVAHALSQSGMSYEDIDVLLADQMSGNQAAEIIPMSAPAPQASVVSIAAPAPAIEEAVRYSYVTMDEIRSSDDLLVKYNTVLDALRLEFEAKTKVGNSKYGLMPYLNKAENREMRLNPLSWDRFPQKPQMFATDPEDAQIVPAAQQAHIMQCLTFNDYLSAHKSKIAELENIAEAEPMKDKQALLNALVNPNARIGDLGNLITNFRANTKWF
ncbi:MAG: hypothetical protein ACRYGR_10260 [Janthinobacterium lividum]